MDIKKLKADYDKAVKAEEALIEERRSNREKMTRSDFRKYNDETRDKQKKLAADRVAAGKAITEHLNSVRQEIFVGNLTESEALNG